jgi:hypothetical protein
MVASLFKKASLESTQPSEKKRESLIHLSINLAFQAGELARQL